MSTTPAQEEHEGGYSGLSEQQIDLMGRIDGAIEHSRAEFHELDGLEVLEVLAMAVRVRIGVLKDQFHEVQGMADLDAEDED